ncbi:hypothetical protein BH23GEM9_BH23GEM9_01890 [soil metagenome]
MTEVARGGFVMWTAAVALCGWLLVLPEPVAAQTLLERTANLSGGWVGPANVLHVNVVHRFNHSGAPARQVQNSPTFLVGYATSWSLLGGVQYATRSSLVAGVPNEWELFVRGRLPRDRMPGHADLALQLGYNAAAESVDAEVSAGRAVGPALLLASVRGLSRDAVSGAGAFAVGGGIVLRLLEHVAAAVDAGQRWTAGDAHRAVWGAALQLQLPATPHTLSLHATNTDAATLHSSSMAGARTRWGFEFTVPVDSRRYFPSSRAASAALIPAGGDVTPVAMRNLRYEPDTLRVRPGTVVEWRNYDPLPHTATAADGSWDSGEIQPHGVWRREFPRAGRFEVVCTPHPFMRALIIVE